MVKRSGNPQLDDRRKLDPDPGFLLKFSRKCVVGFMELVKERPEFHTRVQKV